MEFNIKNTQGWRNKHLQSPSHNNIDFHNLTYPINELNMCLRFKEITFCAHLCAGDNDQWVMLEQIECEGDDITDDAILIVIYDEEKETLTTLYDLLADYALEQFQ